MDLNTVIAVQEIQYNDESELPGIRPEPWRQDKQWAKRQNPESNTNKGQKRRGKSDSKAGKKANRVNGWMGEGLNTPGKVNKTQVNRMRVITACGVKQDTRGETL